MGLSLFKKNRSIPDYPSSGLTASAQFGESMASTGQTQAMQFLKQSPLKHLHLYQAIFMPIALERFLLYTLVCLLKI